MVDQIFSACSAVAMIGWVALAVLPSRPFAVQVFARMLVPGAIGVVYLYLLLTSAGSMPADGGFGSLAEIKKLFAVDQLLLAGWIHYLAFDLFVGSWEVEDARKRGLSHWLVLPCLFLTLMAGPAGLLIYLILRTALSPRPPADDLPQAPPA